MVPTYIILCTPINARHAILPQLLLSVTFLPETTLRDGKEQVLAAVAERWRDSVAVGYVYLPEDAELMGALHSPSLFPARFLPLLYIQAGIGALCRQTLHLELWLPCACVGRATERLIGQATMKTLYDADDPGTDSNAVESRTVQNVTTRLYRRGLLLHEDPGLPDSDMIVRRLYIVAEPTPAYEIVATIGVLSGVVTPFYRDCVIWRMNGLLYVCTRGTKLSAGGILLRAVCCHSP